MKYIKLFEDMNEKEIADELEFYFLSFYDQGLKCKYIKNNKVNIISISKYNSLFDLTYFIPDIEAIISKMNEFSELYRVDYYIDNGLTIEMSQFKESMESIIKKGYNIKETEAITLYFKEL